MRAIVLIGLCGLAGGCGGATGTGPDPVAAAVPIVAPVAAAAPAPGTPGALLRSPTNQWGAYGYQWPDGTWTNYIPQINPWK